MHYYKKNIGDYAKKAGRLSMLQHGSYTLLIDACYDREQFPTMEEAIEWSWASSPAEVDAVEFVLRKFFKLENGFYVHPEIRSDLDDYHAKAGKNKQIAIDREANRKHIDTLRTRTVHEASPNHKPVTSNQEPAASNQQPITENKENPKSNPIAPADAVAAEKKPRTESKAAPGTGKVWAAYATAYWNRYGAEPVRNAMVNGQLSNLVKRIGLDDAEHVAAFFVGHPHRYYVEKMHGVGLLLADCEKLRTEWATSTQMTQAQAAQADKTATNLNSFAPLIAAAKAREEAERNANGQ